MVLLLLLNADSHETPPDSEEEELPLGVIVMWGGLVASIPADWALCDGQNGTPDLRGRFIKGAAGEAGGSGGAATHTHAGHSAHVFTQPAAHSDHTGVISHTHVQDAHTHTQNAHNHVLTELRDATTGGATTNIALTADTSSTLGTKVSGSMTATNQNATAVNQTPVGAVSTLAHSAHSGGSVDGHSAHDTVSNEPAFYELCFIQRVA